MSTNSIHIFFHLQILFCLVEMSLSSVLQQGAAQTRVSHESNLSERNEDAPVQKKSSTVHKMLETELQLSNFRYYTDYFCYFIFSASSCYDRVALK